MGDEHDGAVEPALRGQPGNDVRAAAPGNSRRSHCERPLYSSSNESSAAAAAGRLGSIAAAKWRAWAQPKCGW